MIDLTELWEEAEKQLAELYCAEEADRIVNEMFSKVI